MTYLASLTRIQENMYNYYVEIYNEASVHPGFLILSEWRPRNGRDQLTFLDFGYMTINM